MGDRDSAERWTMKLTSRSLVPLDAKRIRDCYQLVVLDTKWIVEIGTGLLGGGQWRERNLDDAAGDATSGGDEEQ